MLQASKAFFFEKKKQKTFVSTLLQRLRCFLTTPGTGKCGEAKVFCFFFSKKKAFLAFLLCLVTTAQAQTYATLAGEPDPRDFVKRDGTALTLQGRPMRFGGVNITWLGLRQDGTAEPRRPTAFEVRDALATARALGAEVVRLPGLAATAGCRLCLEPKPGQLNPEVFAQIDLVLETARDMGLKLILPLADPGTDCAGAGATGVICASTRQSAGAPAGQAAFFTDPGMQAAFSRRVRAILTHVNSLSGAVYGNDPAILAWEDCDGCAAAGEAQAVSAWVERTGQAVHAADTRHLYESGAFAGHLGPAAASGAVPAQYATPSVDVIGDRLAIAGEPASVRGALSRQVEAVSTAGRAYVLDDFGWSPAAWRTEADLEAWMADVVRERLIQGALTGNLQGHADQGGYLPPPPQATPGLAALYFPGLATPDMTLPTMQERGRALRRFNFAMTDVTLAPSYLLTPKPEILGVAHGRITWRGSAGAGSYTVERSPDPSAPGTWTTICDGCANDAAGFWQDPSPPETPAYYRVMPLNINGHKAVPSEPFRGN